MANMNLVVLIGRLTKDIDLRYISSGTAVGKFGLAVNRRKKYGDTWIEETDFFDITVWGKIAENLSQYLTKGKEIAVEGELKQNRWEQDGQSRSKIEITARNIQLLGGMKESRNDSQPNNQKPESKQGSSELFQDDIPF